MSSNPQPKSRRSSKSTPRPNTKRTGERSEAAFLHKAASLGFGIAKPWGDSERYDFILDNGRKLLRVQIKATDSLRAHAYETPSTPSPKLWMTAPTGKLGPSALPLQMLT